MKAVILAGGEGTRLRPLTLKVPKPVVPIVNVPFLRYQLELLKKYNVDETILSVGYQPEKIESVLGQSNKLHYIVENVPLGTAGAYKNAESFLDGSTLVFNGDILCNFDLNKIIGFHKENVTSRQKVSIFHRFYKVFRKLSCCGCSGVVRASTV